MQRGGGGEFGLPFRSGATLSRRHSVSVCFMHNNNDKKYDVHLYEAIHGVSIQHVEELGFPSWQSLDLDCKLDQKAGQRPGTVEPSGGNI